MPAEVNQHFRQVVAGASPEVLTQLGEALLALDAQRRGTEQQAAAKLRAAYIALARHITRNAAAGLSPQQELFLLSGALGDTVAVKAPSGERVEIPLLKPELYATLLDGLGAPSSAAQLLPNVLGPARRLAVLARSELKPLDPMHPGRFVPQPAGEASTIGLEQLAAGLRQLRLELGAAQQQLTQDTQQLAHAFRAERLTGLSSRLNEYNAALAELLRQPDPALLAGQQRAARAGSELLDLLSLLRSELDATLSRLGDAVRQGALATRRLQSVAAALVSAEAAALGGEAYVPNGEVLNLSEEGLKLADRDIDTTHALLSQLMANAPSRNPLHASRILLNEHFDKMDDPLHNCCATPQNIAAALAKLEALHPNCFSHDAAGRPQTPPIIIEPGCGLTRWLDDRFVICFICSEPGLTGKELSFSPLELAVAQIYGMYLARGDIFNYRGERIADNFMAEYAGEIESRTAVKFTGEQKKMTYVSASAERDSASREDAVRDYVDFLFHVSNNLPLPKRISARKLGVLLKYCIIGDVPRSAGLVLKHVAPGDFQLAREIMHNLAQKDPVRVVELFRSALDADVQLASRYRRDLLQALRDVMGREFASEAQALLSGKPAAESAAAEGSSSANGHDYFDL